MDTTGHKTFQTTTNSTTLNGVITETTVYITFIDGVEVQREETISTWVSKITQTITRTSISNNTATKTITKVTLIDNDIVSKEESSEVSRLTPPHEPYSDFIESHFIDQDKKYLTIYKNEIDSLKKERKEVLDSQVLHMHGKTMRFITYHMGNKPHGGYALYFGMHGGGGCESHVNDGQWENHKCLYKNNLDGAIWFVPRSPEDAWNMWHLSYIDDMFAYIIESYMILEEINPNKVYLTGYSAGGDGTYKLTPRNADRLAGAAMMAGHPNGASMLGVRNIFFSIQVGGNDSGYNRNKIAREYGEELHKLRSADPEGYDHHVKIHEKHAHWMYLDDADVFDIMGMKARNPYPTKVVFKQCNDVLKKHCYWLSLPDDKLIYGSLIVAVRNGNVFEVKSDDVDEFIINLNEKIINFDLNVIVRFNGHEVFNSRVVKDDSYILETARIRHDPYYLFCAKIKI